MNLELRKIKYAAFASEETHCYSAELFLDGKKIADVGNDGHGGCDRQYFINKEIEAKVIAYFKTLPKETHFGMEMEQTLEGFCSDRVTASLFEKDLKKLLKKKNTLTIAKDSKIMTTTFKSPEVLSVEFMISKRKPLDGEVILNTVSFDKAIELYKQAASTF